MTTPNLFDDVELINLSEREAILVRCEIEGRYQDVIAELKKNRTPSTIFQKCENLHYEAVSFMFKPCPFCGNVPIVFKIPDERYGSDAEGWFIECAQMGCMFDRSLPDQSLKHLAENWNTRS